MARKKKQKRDTRSKSVFDLTTRELRDEIRKRTAEVNITISEYRESVRKGIEKANQVVEDSIRKMREASAGISKKTGKVVVPKGRKGEIGLGLTYKTKSELQRQLAGLRRFEEKDIYTPKGKEKWNEKTNKQYETFKNRYGDISREDYDDMIDTMNIVKNTLKDYGYEDFGGSYARTYTRANKEGKRKFARYVDQARRESSGKTTEDVLDRVAELLRENGELV